MSWTLCLPPLALAYGLGAVPFSYGIARARGVDLRRVGSGNVGATNVFRSVGRSWGLLALALDILKGYAAAAVLPRLAGPDPVPWLPLACGLAAVAGHTWPVFLGFRGGKGVATGAGMLAGAAPAAAGVAVAVWIVAFAVRRIVSLASMAASIAAAASAWFLYPAPPRILPPALTALAALVLWRHRTNWERLRNGTEPRIGRREAGS